MSIHVQRAERSRASSYILVIGLLCALGVFIFEAYKEPRAVYVEAMPESAKLYIGNDVVCDSLPCEITFQYWPKAIRVVADRHYSQSVRISIIDYFSSKRHQYEINLEPFPFRAPELEMTLEETVPSLPLQDNMPTPKYLPPPPVSASKQKADIPIECRETNRERQEIRNRLPILCYSEDDKAVTHNAVGECYAAYWVSVKGRAQKLQGFGCMHDEPLDAARRAFENRIYLPGLKNGKPVEKAVETEIKYGPRPEYIPQPESDLSTSTSINRDAQILSCPPSDPPKSMMRSGHCIFEFDLSSSGQISQIRQIKCTHADLKPVTLSILNQCQFMPAHTDGAAVPRPYMKHKIDVDIYDAQRRKIPVHASFSEKAVNKPYIIYE